RSGRPPDARSFAGRPPERAARCLTPELKSPAGGRSPSCLLWCRNIISGIGHLPSMANIWARKSTAVLLNEAAQGDDVDGATRPFRRTLSALIRVALAIGGIIGAGIFVLAGHADAACAGPAYTLSFLVGQVA